MISHEYKCIYIHIPKTAGTSIEKHFGSHGKLNIRLKQDHRTIRNFMSGTSPFSDYNNILISILRYANQHIQAKLYGLDCVNAEQFSTYFKFTFVRNPWDRAYSWFRNVIRDPIHQKKLDINKDITFSDFLVHYPDQWALMPQLDWISDKSGNLTVDYIGKFENLNSDFEKICNRLGIDNIDLPAILNSGNVSYTNVYDNKSRKLIADRYHTEIELFGYTFGH